MSQAAVQIGARVGESRPFYVWMSGICLVIAVLGFMPTYFMPLARGTFAAEPVVHIHGLILFSWVVMFFTQSLLVARGRVLAHREWGLLGIAVMTAVVFIIVTLVSLRIRQASAPGLPPGMAHDVRAFEWPIFSGAIYLAVLFVLAVTTIRRPHVHKRLLLLATISMLGAPIGRWFMVLLSPPPGAGDSQLSVPPVSVLVTPSLVADLLVIAAMIYDWRTRGRPHAVYLFGGGVLLLLQITAVPIAATAAWQSVAAALGHLAG
jgi:hypothetical protein